MRPKNAKPARAQGLPKIHKELLNIPKFRPINDTTGTSYSLVGKYLASLLYPLTTNKFSLKILLMQPTELKLYHHIFSKRITNMYLLMWNHYSPMISSNKLLT